MLTQEKVLDALKTVKEPFINKSIVEIDAVKEIKIKEGLVSVKIAISKPGTAEQMKLQAAVVNAI